jgi:hypothetical protein
MYSFAFLYYTHSIAEYPFIVNLKIAYFLSKFTRIIVVFPSQYRANAVCQASLADIKLSRSISFVNSSNVLPALLCLT